MGVAPSTQEAGGQGISDVQQQPGPSPAPSPSQGLSTPPGQQALVDGLNVATGGDITDLVNAGIAGQLGLVGGPPQDEGAVFRQMPLRTSQGERVPLGSLSGVIGPMEEEARGDALNRLFAMSQRSLVDLQRRLFAAGFYDGLGVDFEDIRWGVPDETTQKAWSMVVDRAVGFHAAGKRMTTDDVIEQQLELGGRGEGPGSGRTYKRPIHLANPKDLGDRLDTVARSVVGRKANRDEKKMFVKLMHQEQRRAQQQQMRANRAAGEQQQVREVIEPANVDASAVRFLENQAPAEATAASVSEQYDAFLSMIGGRG